MNSPGVLLLVWAPPGSHVRDVIRQTLEAQKYDARIQGFCWAEGATWVVPNDTEETVYERWKARQ